MTPETQASLEQTAQWRGRARQYLRESAIRMAATEAMAQAAQALFESARRRFRAAGYMPNGQRTASRA